ncbi:MAG TPA: glutamine amidotransferase [Blastocatellia bacterium]|nr:glutamine amidotransferase [Blastocatellia bacterium]
MEQVVSFLFKYRGALFSKGHLTFGARPPVILILIVATVIGALGYFLYSRRKAKVSGAPRVLLISLRSGLLMMILLLLMQPVIVVPSVVPQSSFVAVLMDDSASMRIPDEAGGSRLDTIKRLSLADGPLYKSLSSKFKVRSFKYSSNAEPVDDSTVLSGGGQETNIAASLEQVSRDLAGVPVSGIILMTDGAENSDGDITATMTDLRSRGIPVFTVGVGATTLKGDVEVARATAPRRVLSGSPVNAQVLIHASDVGNRALKLDVSEDGHPLRSEEVQVNSGVASQLVTAGFTPSSPGTHRYAFTVQPLRGEPLTDNNSQSVLIDVEDSHPKVLYVEGEPRWEFGKIRESTYEEKNVVLVSLLRSADGKFYRQGVENGQEMASGLPSSQEDLFKYDAIMLGSIESTFFTFDQLKSLEEFVSKRGGTLLALCGAKSFDRGGYSKTPLADLLPVYLSGETPEDWESQTYKAYPAERGKDNPAARLQDSSEANQKAWDHMPAITLPEVMTAIKPGATVILQARSLKEPGVAVPLLAEERYGKGRSLVFLASDTWRWRMMLESSDTSFETFWRNLLRYIVQSARRQAEVSTERSFYGKSETVKIHVDLADTKYNDITDADVTAHIKDPAGHTIDTTLKPAEGRDAEGYTGTFTPVEDGRFEIEISAVKHGDQKQLILPTAQTSFLVGELNREAYGAAQNQGLLKRIASETGGAYYTADAASTLAEDISHSGAGDSTLTTFDLWDMPINFLLISTLASVEWFFRKRKGLA